MKIVFGMTHRLFLPELSNTFLPQTPPEVAQAPPDARGALVEYERFADLVRGAAGREPYMSKWIRAPGIREYVVSFAGSAGRAVSKQWAAMFMMHPHVAAELVSFLRQPAEFVVEPSDLRHVRQFLARCKVRVCWKMRWCVVHIVRARQSIEHLQHVVGPEDAALLLPDDSM